MAHPRSRIAALVIGCLLLFPALGLLAAGAGLGLIAAPPSSAHPHAAADTAPAPDTPSSTPELEEVHR